MILERFKPISVVMVFGVTAGILGLIAGAILMVVGEVQIGKMPPLEAGIIGIGILITVFTVVGLLLGVVLAFTYDIVARFTGGVRTEVELPELELALE